jgi:ABC-type dipeptide/oligopeptide/nickel transport system ATPase component
MRLRCAQLGVSFESLRGAVRALRDLSFETREREFLAFVGPSGCG